MNINNIAKARKEYVGERTGISPLCGNINLEDMVARGIITRTVIAVMDNGIEVVGYCDLQNRLVATTHEPSYIKKDLL